VPVPPPQSAEQRRAALARAAEARQVRAEVKEKLRAGAMDLDEVFDRAVTDEHVARLKVLTLLESLPKVGKVKSRRLMKSIGIAESRRVKGLGAEQRKALLEAFPAPLHSPSPAPTQGP
jgi:hypothetical protein